MTNVQSFQTIIHYYVHEDVKPLFIPVDEGVFLADWQNTKAAIYGNCPKDLLIQLLEFGRFPGCLNRFGPKSRVYTDPYSVYYSYNKDRERHQYVYKQTLFNIMMVTLPLEDPAGYADSLVAYALSVYFKHQEMKLNGECEMVPYLEEKFEALKNKLEEGLKTPANEMNKHNITIAKSLQLVKKALDKLCPNAQLDTLTYLYTQIGNKHPISQQPQFWRKIVHTTLVFLKIVDKFVRDEKPYFMPNRLIDKGYPTMPRLFKSGDKAFYLVREILREFERYKLTAGEFEEDLKSRFNSDDIATILYHETSEKWNTFVREMAFEEIPCTTFPIERTKHHAIYIPSYEDKHCIMASDSFLEMLRVLITVKGIFQVVDKSNWDSFMDHFRIGRKYQDYDAKNPILLDLFTVYRTNNLIISQVLKQMDEKMEKIKEVTPIGEEGFNQAALEEQIRILNLDTCFPNIMEFVPVVFPRIKEKKEVLATCDMYDALEYCQLLAFFDKFPDRKNWLKVHGAHKQIPFVYMEPPVMEPPAREPPVMA